MTDYLTDNYRATRPADKDNLKNILSEFFRADQKEQIDILEPGCGPGRILEILSGIPNLNITGIDKRSDIVKIASDHVQSSNVNILQGNFLSYDFKNLKYDYIFFSHYLHLQSDATKHIEKARSLLKSGGRLLFLFEDCSYYSLLLGYPPALAEHHSFLKLYREIQKDDNLRQKLKSIGPYLPHEIAKVCCMKINLFPYPIKYTCQKEVKWSDECTKKNASVFHLLTDEEIKKCIGLGDTLEDTFKIQPYLFYTGEELSYKITTNPEQISNQNIMDTPLNLKHFFDYFQTSFSDVFNEYPAVFLSTWPLHKTSAMDNDDRDVFFAGSIPKSELSYWYYSYKKNLEGFHPSFSPSYVVANHTDPYNANSPVIYTDDNLKASLNKLYKDFKIAHDPRSIDHYIVKSLKPSLEWLTILLKYLNTNLDALYFYYLNYVVDEKKQMIPIVILSTNEVDYQKKQDVLAIFENHPQGDQSVSDFFSSPDNITWKIICADQSDQDLYLTKTKSIQILESAELLLAGKAHRLEGISMNIDKERCDRLKSYFREIRSLFSDNDILAHNGTDTDSAVKMACLCKRRHEELYLWDWLDYVTHTLHHKVVNDTVDIRNSAYRWYDANYLSTVFEILEDEATTQEFTWIHNISKMGNKLIYKMNMESSEGTHDHFRLHFDEAASHQNTKIWCHVFQNLFGGPLFQFDIKSVWNVNHNIKSQLKNYLLITVNPENIIVEGCKSWEIPAEQT